MSVTKCFQLTSLHNFKSLKTAILTFLKKCLLYDKSDPLFRFVHKLTNSDSQLRLTGLSEGLS